MNQTRDTRLQLANEARQNFKQLNVRQFSRDLLEFNKLMGVAVNDCGDNVMKAQTDKYLVQEATRLKQKYPVEHYERKFIDQQLKGKNEKKLEWADGLKYNLTLTSGLTYSITYAVIVGGMIGVASAAGLSVFASIAVGAVIGTIFAFVAIDSEVDMFDKYWGWKYQKWEKVREVFDIINKFKNADDLRKPVGIRISSAASSYSAPNTSITQPTSLSGQKTQPVEKDFFVHGGPQDQTSAFKPPNAPYNPSG